jgi:sterol desaturase/sphingolipid hydroxylase (fatty acid hydroxylase superfamily)
MQKLRVLVWWLGLAFTAGLVLLVGGYGRLASFAHEHRTLTLYLLLGALLVIPARVIALVAVYLIELLFVGWQRSSARMLWRPEASVRLDILSALVMLLLPQRYIGYLLSFGLLYLIDRYAARHIDISLTPLLGLWGLQLVCFLLLSSFLSYWVHRLEHAIPALWALHKFHHSADRLTILTTARQTQLTKGLESGLMFLPMGLFTAPTAALPVVGSVGFLAVGVYFAYHTLILLNGGLCHSNLRTGYGWLGRWLIVSPRMHRLHHAMTPNYYNRNFGNDLVIWDRLFGTYAMCEADVDISTIAVGLNDNPFNQQPTLRGVLREYFIKTYWVCWQELRRGFAALVPGRFGTPPVRDASGG